MTTPSYDQPPQIRPVTLTKPAVDTWAETDRRYRNWPVVYILDGAKSVYIGESLNVAGRFRQHLDSPSKQSLTGARVVIDETFNKSACLDLESRLIQLFAGDGKFTVLNRNEGITDTDYFARDTYWSRFDEIFDSLRDDGLFDKPISAIENSSLFKLSPFKALTEDQRISVNEIMESLFDDLEHDTSGTTVIQGEPGTGKTIVAIFLLKLLADVKASTADSEPSDESSLFADFFTDGYSQLLTDFRFGIVIPQQALRRSVQRVFKQVPGLDPSMVVDPFSVGKSTDRFDLLIVDEAHRLSQRSQQASGIQNRDFADINTALYGTDDKSRTQLDWILTQSRHQILLVDAKQTVRPGDLPADLVSSVLAAASTDNRFFTLKTQHRVAAGDDYVGYIRQVLAGENPAPQHFDGYDLQFFDDIGELDDAVKQREASDGLSRLIAGYAWEWKSRSDPDAYDIEIDGRQFRWNTKIVDWIASPTSIDEVGSIHTTQGYDLNVAGVIIGNDLRYDPVGRRIWFDRSNYFDARGKANNKQLGITYSNDDILEYVRNVYAVLLTRGIVGTYVYVCDPHLREYLRPYFS